MAKISSAHIDSSQFSVAGRWSNGNGKRSWISANQFWPLNFSRPDSKNSQARNTRSARGANQSPARSRFRCRPLTAEETEVVMGVVLFQVRAAGQRHTPES
ncbi:hypothetical protein D3C76_1578180 [compost metagenome]